MDGAALGARCLDHLSELDKQRSLCSNFSGQVAGRMKDSRIIATEITKALIEKLMTVGDVYSLRNENFSLKEEVNELKRKEQTQNKEIETLRKMISNLEREVRSLKEGFGPFSASMPPSVQTVVAKTRKAKTPDKQTESRRGDKAASSYRQQEATHQMMEVEYSSGSTPGCSLDEEYMNRRVDWPSGKGTSSWTGMPETGKESRVSNKSPSIKPSEMHSPA